MKNKIFTDSILDLNGKDYRKEKKIDWEKIEEKACIAVCVGAVGFMIIHLIILIV